LTPLLEAALSYAAKGWAVLPLFGISDGACHCGTVDCKYAGKHPIGSVVHHGVKGASSDPSTLTRWFTLHPTANIGIATGSASQLVVIDLDDRPLDGRDGSVTWRRLLAAHEGGQQCDTVEAITGGGGRHVFFAAPALSVRSSKDAIGPGVEVKSDGGYVVAAPSQHKSGRPYEWESSSHPDDVEVAPLPAWLLALCQTRAPRTETADRPSGQLDDLEVAELQSALLALPSDDRDQWVRIGMALHATNDDQKGFDLWDQWSQTSPKYDALDCARVWKSFRPTEEGLSPASIYHEATKAGWVRPSLEALFRQVGYEVPDFSALLDQRQRPAALFAPTDPLLQSLPGCIESIARWSYQNAPRPDHVYSVAAALMTASVLAGRRYVTSGNNYAALYFLVVGKSGTGKEHIRTTVESVLRSANAPKLIGPNTFTSSAAVWSAVLHAPQSVAIIDEFGQFLASASGGSDGAQMKDGVLTTLMELWGRVASTAQTPQYATLALTDRQRESMQRKSIDRPSLVLGGLTTPAMFYGALKSARVASGFINRHLILHGNTQRQAFTLVEPSEVPQPVADWAIQLLAPPEGTTLDTLQRAENIPAAKRLTFMPQSKALFAAFDQDCMDLADRLESAGLGELPMRAAEQAMRLSLVAALAEDPHAQEIAPSFASWGVDVARWMLLSLVPAVQSQMAENPLHALRNRVLQAVGAEDEGLTQHELQRHAVFRGVSRKDRDDLIAWAVETQHATWELCPTGGRPRRVLRLSNTEKGGVSA
jgi:hypothetical protein